MAIPKFEDFLYPFMQHLMEKDSNKADMITALSDYFNISDEDRQLKTKGGSAYQVSDRIGSSLQWLRRALFVELPERGVWKITQRGRDYMMSHSDLRESDLMEYPEFAEYSGRRDNGESNTKHTISASAFDETYLKQNDNWLEIVETIKPIIEAHSPYNTFYNSVVTCFRLLGWKKSKGTIVTFPSNDSNLKEGLIFLTIEKDNLHIPIVPLDLTDSYTEESRLAVLFRAMEKWNCMVGLLFSETIQVFYKNMNDDTLPACISTINLNESDLYGYAICNLFSFNSFNYKQIEQFCEREYDKIPSVTNVLKRIHSISKDSLLIEKLVKDYLMTEGFDEDVINVAFEKCIFSIKIKDVSGLTMEPEKKERPKSTRDTTQFSFDGGKTFYKKRQFVLNVVRQYIKEHPTISLDSLEKIFPSEIISKTRGVVRPLSVVQEWIKEKPDVATRYFMAPNEIITLSDGMQIVVHNQWGDSFPNFLAIANQLYGVVSDRPYEGMDNKPDLASEPEPEEKYGIKISADSFSKFKNKK